MDRRELLETLGTAGAGAVSGVMSSRVVMGTSPAVAGEAIGVSLRDPGWFSGPMSLQELHDLTAGLLEHGVAPETKVATYVDGRPGQYGPAVLRLVTWIKPEGAVSAGDRLHFIRHTGGPGGVEVVTLG